MARFFIALFIISSTTYLSANSGVAGPPVPQSTVSLGLELRENFDVGKGPTSIFGNEGNQLLSLWCPTTQAEHCTKATSIYGDINLGICKPTSELDCVDNAWAVDQTGKKINGELLKTAPIDTRFDIPENVDLNLPGSRGMGSIWRFPGVFNGAGVDTYFISAQSYVWLNKSSGIPISASKFIIDSPRVAIVAVREVAGSFTLAEPDDVSRGGRGPGVRGSSQLPDKSQCIATDPTSCQQVVQFPDGYRFGLKLNVSQPLNGWFHGRFFQPAITSGSWKRGTSLSIEAEPVKVPSLDFLVPNSQIPEAAKKLIFSGRDWGQSGGPEQGIKVTEQLSGPDIFNLINAFIPSYNNKASATTSYWSFKSLNFDRNSKVGRCSTNKTEVSGFVTTNALGYSPGPPEYDSSTDALEYKVSSPHLEASGLIASGSYDLVIQSEVARCIYGFSNAPIKAEISILDESGENRVATTFASEKDGWFALSAKNFTYSAPTLKVKLTQEKPKEVVVETKVESAKPVEEVVVAVKPVEVAAPAVKPAPSKKSLSIVCSKGKVTKKITGVNPKCPTGYRKK